MGELTALHRSLGELTGLLAGFKGAASRMEREGREEEDETK